MSDREGEIWRRVAHLTEARIGLGITGDSLPTRAVLALAESHARARHAIAAEFDALHIVAAAEAEGLSALEVHSKVKDRSEYLRRPDLGRRLDASSCRLLANAGPAAAHEIVFVIADGLSPRAPNQHGVPFLRIARELLDEWNIGPVVVARQARVALGDEVGEILGAEAVVMMIGERPGLSSVDSLGLYITYAPRVGRTDAERNCISNIRPGGLSYRTAADTLHFLLQMARKIRATGVALKEGEGSHPQLAP